MKTLQESILSSTKTGKSEIYSLGKRLIIDNIPCTVIYNDGSKIIVLSDTFCGTQGNKPVFKENCEIDHRNYAFYGFAKEHAQEQRKYLPRGWNIPLTEWFRDKSIQDALREYIRPNANFAVSKKFWTREKRTGNNYRYVACNSECPSGEAITFSVYYESIGVRFAKTINL